jgi:hypothetical protein
MQELRVIGAEQGALLLVADGGEQFRLVVDEVLHSQLRRTSADSGEARKLSPREIQAHIRAGMSAQDVANVTGASLEYVQRFEGPIMAEREYVVEAALAVPVHSPVDVDPLGSGATFGTAIRERLAELGAVGERWASWKEQGGGWIVKLAYAVDRVEHDARWEFEPKKQLLSPISPDATALSQQEEPPAPQPRLRAVEREDRARFDSGAFSPLPQEPVVGDIDVPEPPRALGLVSRVPTDVVEPIAAPEPESEPEFLDEVEDADEVPIDELRTRPAPRTPVAAAPPAPARLTPRRPVKDDDDPSKGPLSGSAIVSTGHTADLLEALRRRRGEREAANFSGLDESKAQHPSTGSIRIVDVPLEGATEAEQPTIQPATPSRRRGRAAMPSWDEIVFGARPDDDLS